MGEVGYARSFRDLVVYRKSREIALDIFRLSKQFPREEMYSLTDQVRRSGRAIGSQIAEAWGKRRYERHFVSKLTDSDAEQLETQHWVEVACDCAYLTAENATRLNGQLSEIGRMLNSMILKAEQFCQPDGRLLREPHAEYFVQ